jgi:hypothetical protein
MVNFLKKVLLIGLATLLISSLFMTPAEAANRTGSHRVGGTNSHGKGSHYAGGHFIEQIDISTTSDFKLKGFPSCINYEVKKSLYCK